MTSNDAQAFAVQWAEAWNSRDIERVLAHFHNEVEFTSPTAG
jgi:ketosteroid isomerase-like protein